MFIAFFVPSVDLRAHNVALALCGVAPVRFIVKRRYDFFLTLFMSGVALVADPTPN